MKNQLKTKLKDYKQRLENVASLDQLRSKVGEVYFIFCIVNYGSKEVEAIGTLVSLMKNSGN